MTTIKVGLGDIAAERGMRLRPEVARQLATPDQQLAEACALVEAYVRSIVPADLGHVAIVVFGAEWGPGNGGRTMVINGDEQPDAATLFDALVAAKGGGT